MTIETPLFSKADESFIAAVKAMEKRTASVSAYVIVNPRARDVAMVCPAGHVAGRVVITYGASGMCRVVAWLPGPVAEGRGYRHHGRAGGGGYDKASAAMSGARFVSCTGESAHVLPDDGMGWRWHLEQAGYIVAAAV